MSGSPEDAVHHPNPSAALLQIVHEHDHRQLSLAIEAEFDHLQISELLKLKVQKHTDTDTQIPSFLCGFGFWTFHTFLLDKAFAHSFLTLVVPETGLGIIFCTDK